MMKKLMFTIAGIMLATGGFAQTDSTSQQQRNTDTQSISDSLSNNAHDMDEKNKAYSKQGQNMDEQASQKSAKSHPDGILMTGGKMWMVTKGKKTMLDHTMTLSNGTIVMSDGSYTTKTGEKLMFKDDEHMDMEGKLSQGKPID